MKNIYYIYLDVVGILVFNLTNFFKEKIKLLFFIIILQYQFAEIFKIK